MKSEEKIAILMREVLEQEIRSVRDDVSEIRKMLEGNGKPGLIAEVNGLKAMRTWAIGYAAGLTLLIGIFGVYIRGFVEDVFRHIYGR